VSAQRVKIRIQFEKLGTVRFTSHKDVVRIFERAFGAAGVPVAWSEGFHPHMRMSFGPPLRTGWESREEYMDVTMDGSMDGFASAVNEKLPEGLVITRVVAIDDRTPKLAADMSAVANSKDGNTVNFEHELMQLNQNTLAHALETQLVTGSLLRLKLAISGKP